MNSYEIQIYLVATFIWGLSALNWLFNSRVITCTTVQWDPTLQICLYFGPGGTKVLPTQTETISWCAHCYKIEDYMKVGASTVHNDDNDGLGYTQEALALDYTDYKH